MKHSLRMHMWVTEVSVWWWWRAILLPSIRSPVTASPWNTVCFHEWCIMGKSLVIISSEESPPENWRTKKLELDGNVSNTREECGMEIPQEITSDVLIQPRWRWEVLMFYTWARRSRCNKSKPTGGRESSCSSCDNEGFWNYRQRETVTPVPETSPCCCLIHRPVDIKMVRPSVGEASVAEHAAFSLKLF